MKQKVILVKDLSCDEPRIVGIYNSISTASKVVRSSFKKEGIVGVWMTKGNRYIATRYNVE